MEALKDPVEGHSPTRDIMWGRCAGEVNSLSSDLEGGVCCSRSLTYSPCLEGLPI